MSYDWSYFISEYFKVSFKYAVKDILQVFKDILKFLQKKSST